MQYYYVEVGRNPGIYSSWEECNYQVKGFSGAVFRKVSPDVAISLNSKGVPLHGGATSAIGSGPIVTGDIVDANDPPPWEV